MSSATAASAAAPRVVAAPQKYNHLNPASAAYSVKNAIAMSKLSDAAYLPQAEFTKVAKSLGFDDVRFFTKGSSQAYVVVKDDAVVVAFRGTEKKAGDFIDDAKVVRTEFVTGEKGTKVHRGFKAATEDVWAGPNGIEATLKSLRSAKPGRSVLLTGHSLGGAMATVATAELAKAGTPATGTYVFGSPRVGNEEFAAWFDKTVTTLYPHQKQNDAVTRVPGLLNWLPELSDWSEVGHKNQRYLAGTGDVMVGAGWSDKFMDRFYGRVESSIPKFEKTLDWAMEHGSAKTKAAIYAARKLVNLANPSEEPKEKITRSWADIWMTDGIRDHSMAGYVDAVSKMTAKD